MKNNYTIIKHLIYGFFLIGLVLIVVGCSCNNKGNKKTQNSSIQPKDEIVIKTESFLEQDIKDRLQKINQDSTIPIRIDNANKNCDLAVFVDKNPCEEILRPDGDQNDIKEAEIYYKPILLEPQSFSDNLGDKFSPLGVKIKIASAKDDQINKVIKETLQKSFQENRPEITKSTMVGDIMLGRWVNKRMDELGYDYPFSQVKELFSNSNLNIANLESPFSETGPYNQLGMVFRANPKGAISLKNSGINIVNLANNHFGNAGRDGMNLTFDLLDKNNIAYFGAAKNSDQSHQPKIIKVNGLKFAFLGYSDSSVTPSSYQSTKDQPGLNMDDMEQMKKDLSAARSQADFVIVSLHLGTEYVHSPNQRQLDFAHEAINSGADFIYGHHPHVVESLEVYKEKPIFYSLGNFVFDQNMGKTEQGLAVQIEFMYNKIVGLKLLPIVIVNYAQTQIADLETSENILKIIYNNSK